MATLLSHGAADPRPVLFSKLSAVNLRLEKIGRPNQIFSRGSSGLAGPVFAADIDAAAAHEIVLGEILPQRATPEKVAGNFQGVGKGMVLVHVKRALSAIELAR